MPSSPKTARPSFRCDAPDADYEQRRRKRAPWRAWYGTARWRRIRANQLAAEPLCVMCLREDIVTTATVCDHVDPHRGNPERFWNGPFQSLCKPHHDSDKQQAETSGQGGGSTPPPRPPRPVAE